MNMNKMQPMQMKGHTTFAEMILKDVKSSALSQRLKFPPWNPDIHQRKDQATLSPKERQRFLDAFEMLNQTGQLGQFVTIHADMSHYQHRSLRFLPWHRVFLSVVEGALQSFHPEVSIPYWDWTNPKEQQIPAWLENYKPAVSTSTGNIQVIRSPGTQEDLATIASNIPSIMNAADFPDFSMTNRGGIEAPHNYIHIWVGGTMSIIAMAPADPIFFMHHANIDRLWWKWQTSPKGKGNNPDLPGDAPDNNPVMDPWPYTEPQTRDIANLGYAYI